MLTVRVPRIDCAQCLLLVPYKVTVGSTWVIPENALFAEKAILPITSLESSHDLLSVRIAFQQSMWPAPAWPSPPPHVFVYIKRSLSAYQLTKKVGSQYVQNI